MRMARKMQSPVHYRSVAFPVIGSTGKRERERERGVNLRTLVRRLQNFKLRQRTFAGRVRGRGAGWRI